MKKIIIAVVLVVLLGGGAFFYFNLRKENDLKTFSNSLQTDPNAANNILSMEEVAKHNQKSDCWMVIDKDVVNVTAFVDKHPGGDVILEGCGKDATEYFNGIREHMKAFVKALVQKMLVGKLQS